MVTIFSVASSGVVIAANTKGFDADDAVVEEELDVDGDVAPVDPVGVPDVVEDNAPAVPEDDGD